MLFIQGYYHCDIYYIVVIPFLRNITTPLFLRAETLNFCPFVPAFLRPFQIVIVPGQVAKLVYQEYIIRLNLNGLLIPPFIRSVYPAHNKLG